MKKFALVTGICGIILFIYSLLTGLHRIVFQLISSILNITYEGVFVQIDIKYLVLYYLIFALMIMPFFLYFFLAEKIKRNVLKRVVSILIIVLSVFIYVSLIFNLIFVGANLISMEPLNKEVIVRDGTKEQEKNYVEYQKVFNKFKGKYENAVTKNKNLSEAISTYDFNNKDALTFLEDTKGERNELLNIMSAKIFALPAPDLLTDKSLEQKSDAVLDEWNAFDTDLKHFYNLELYDIKRNLNSNDVEATKRFITLLKSLNNLSEAKNTHLTNNMIIDALIFKLSDFYFDNYKLIDKNQSGELSAVLTSIEKNMDSSFKNSVKGEYLSMKELLTLCHEQYKWPFYDYNKSMNKLTQNYKSILELCDKPYSEIKNSNAEDEIIKMGFVNPLGNYFVGVLETGPSTVEQKEIFKSEIRAAICAANLGTHREMPIDNLTGKSFVIKESKDKYEISTSYEETPGKPKFTFEVKK